MKRYLSALLFLTALSAAPASAQYGLGLPPLKGYDRASALGDTLTIAQDLIALDTQNGNELACAKYLEAALKGIEGVTTQIVPVEGDRANFVAKLSAKRRADRPMIIVGHMDVLPADAEKWLDPPFKPTVREGYLRGRGALFGKGPLAAYTAALIQLSNRRGELRRDVILIATAGGDAGLDWIIANRPELLGNAEFALGEGGLIRVQDGVVRSVNIQTAEKIPYTVRATATGPSGDPAVPLPDNALAALSRAAGRIHEWKPEFHLIEPTERYFELIAPTVNDTILQLAMRNLLIPEEPDTNTTAAEYIARNPFYNALLRTGVSLVQISGGAPDGSIPATAQAVFHVRLIPGQDIEKIVKKMNEVGAEEAVTFMLDGEVLAPSPPSTVGSPIYKSMAEASKLMVPEAIVLPYMSTGTTGGGALQRHGIPTFGIRPFPVTEEDELRAYGADERVPVEALGWGAEFVFRAVYLASR